MNGKTIKYYRENPHAFIEEMFGVKLFEFQIQFLKEYIKNPNIQYTFYQGRHSGKEYFQNIINKIKQELL
jgi:hypothetical protein